VCIAFESSVVNLHRFTISTLISYLKQPTPANMGDSDINQEVNYDRKISDDRAPAPRR
jgi:hypothetical protein